MFDPKKFRPKTAIEILRRNGLEPMLEPAAKTIALSELIAWACLDQEGRVKEKPEPPKKRFLRSKAAMRARHLTTAMLLDHQMKIKANNEVTQLLLSIIMQAGGLRVLIEGRSIKGLLKDLRRVDVTLRCVVEIVRYLVRCQYCQSDMEHATIKYAQLFVIQSQFGLGLGPRGLSKVSKIWEDFKPAAPYLFAFFEERSFQPVNATNSDAVLNWLSAFTSRQNRVTRFLGRAASAMDVVKRTSRDQRTSDFGEIERVPLRARPFTVRERKIISKIDLNSPIYAPYRPKLKILRRAHTTTM
jgi:hypothetical protein